MMDFADFDPSSAITKMEQIQNQHESEAVDDPDERPFVDENPCLLCGHKAFANYIDLTLVTSCTSQTSTPVRKKLRDILKRVWIQSKENNILCLACYDLVDRYDSLEAQLTNIRENIEEKYNKTCIKKHGRVKATNTAKKRGRPKQSANRSSRRQRNSARVQEVPSEGEQENNQIEYDNNDIDDRGADSDYSVNEHELTNTMTDLPQGEDDQNQRNSISNVIPVEVIEDEPNFNVYDENHQQLQRGQKMRLGVLLKGDDNIEVYKCGYCEHTWGDIAQLHNHVHSYHQPEVVDVAIPAELGLGNTMNCGIEIQNCAEPPEGPKPWSCLYCDAAFRARTNMSSHFKDKHTPHKPFTCVDCGEAFRKGIDLNRHKLYFCSERTIQFAPKRKYKKRDAKENKPGKKKKEEIDSD